MKPRMYFLLVMVSVNFVEVRFAHYVLSVSVNWFAKKIRKV